MTGEDLQKIAFIEAASRDRYRHRVSVCTAGGCLCMGAAAVRESLEKEVSARGLDDVCQVKAVGCMGLCGRGPMVAIEPGNTLYQGVTAAEVPQVIESLDGFAIERLNCSDRERFLRPQNRVVLENSGRIDPERIEEYIAMGGYAALFRALEEMTRDQVIAAIERSGLRGRASGHPVAPRWRRVADADGAQGRYVLCNSRADAASSTDSRLMESDPHRIIEGMMIAAYAVGAKQAHVHVRAEQPLALARMQAAIRSARRVGLLEGHVAGKLHLTIDVRRGAGASVCAEDTALIAMVQGDRAHPRIGAPPPEVSGVEGLPTLIHNVETMANIPAIIRHGAEWFAGIGTASSKGTKLISLSGQVANAGLVEAPLGITLRQLIFDIGGGMSGSGKFKAAQTGGFSGVCVSEEKLDVPLELLDPDADSDTDTDGRAAIGSGAVVVIDDSMSIVDVARFLAEGWYSESCGMCTPCRVGSVKINNLLSRVKSGQADSSDLEHLDLLCKMVEETSRCEIGRRLASAVLSTLRNFQKDFTALIKPSSTA